MQHRSAIVPNKNSTGSGLKSGLWILITTSDNAAVSSQSWLEQNMMFCANKMRQLNASPFRVDRDRVDLKRPKAQENLELGQDLSCLRKQHWWQGSCKLGVGLCQWDACRPSPHSPEAGVLNQKLQDPWPLFLLWSRKERAAAKTKTIPQEGSSFPSCYHLTERGGRNDAPLAETKN